MKSKNKKNIAIYASLAFLLSFLALVPWIFPVVGVVTAVLGYLIAFVLIVAACCSDSSVDNFSFYSPDVLIIDNSTYYYPPVDSSSAFDSSGTYGGWAQILGNILFTAILFGFSFKSFEHALRLYYNTDSTSGCQSRLPCYS